MKLTQIILLALFGLQATTQASAELCDPAFSELKPSATVGRPHLILFSAPSGGGKTTLANLLIEEFPNLIQSISSTTRPPRGTEKNGVDYRFLSQADFQNKINEGKFAEYALVHGNYYGTETSTIRAAFQTGKSVLALVDVKGAESLRESFPDEVYTVFINPPDLATLESRLRGRGTDPEEAVQKRLANARQEMSQAKNFDKTVINDNLERAHEELSRLFRKLQLVPTPVQRPN